MKKSINLKQWLTIFAFSLPLIASCLGLYGSMTIEHTKVTELTHQEYWNFWVPQEGTVPFIGWGWVRNKNSKAPIYKKTTRWFGSIYTVESPPKDI